MDIAIIGGGPAGLSAAEAAAVAGASVTVFDSKPSCGRKLLVAGKGGLNLTKIEPSEVFATRYTGGSQPSGMWESLIRGFDHAAFKQWAATLGIETFTASTGRVYPRGLKAAPLLRRWLSRLRESGVCFKMRRRLVEIQIRASGFDLTFEADGRETREHAHCVVLGMGGGSWPETGSDGGWVDALRRAGIEIARLAPANCGWEIAWPPAFLAACEGKPLKNIVVSTGGLAVPGELLISSYGLEGGAIYRLGALLREQARPSIAIDLKPHSTAEQLVAKLPVARSDLLSEARSSWRLSDAAFALLSLCVGGAPASADAMARFCKNCQLQLSDPRPLREAISSAGGVVWSQLDENLMFKAIPGLFAAGEMIDWEAPTGGYLIHGCIAMGRRAGAAAANWISSVGETRAEDTAAE